MEDKLYSSKQRQGGDSLEGLGGPMTKFKTKRAKEALGQMISSLFEVKPIQEDKDPRLVHYIHVAKPT